VSYPRDENRVYIFLCIVLLTVRMIAVVKRNVISFYWNECPRNCDNGLNDSEALEVKVEAVERTNPVYKTKFG